MKLESMAQTGANSACLLLVFDDASKLKVPAHLAAQFDLYAQKELTEEAYAELLAAANLERAHTRAVRIISASAISERALYRRLVEKGESEADAAETVAWLKELRLLDDGKTAEQIVRSAAAKGYGRARAEQMLYEKRIPRELWEGALTHLPQSDEAIDRFVQQRLGGRKLDEKLIKKTLDALIRRGFSWQEARSAISRYREEFADDAPDLEDME